MLAKFTDVCRLCSIWAAAVPAFLFLQIMASETSSACRRWCGGVQTEDIRVKCVSQTRIGHHSGQIERRVLEVHTEETQEPFVCTHYQMLSWPDHGAPEETQPIQDLLDDIDLVRPSRPRCPHRFGEHI